MNDELTPQAQRAVTGPRRGRRVRAAGLAIAVGGGAVLGALVATPVMSNAQESATSSTPAPAPPDGGQPAGPHTVNGKAEELLTGDAKTKVEAATLAAYPGATIERSETDVDGATYEAHITTTDGKHMTVLFDSNFNVSGTQQGMGGGGGHKPGTGTTGN